VRVAERHRVGRHEPAPDQSTYEVGDLRIDVARHKCFKGDREIDLTPKEFGFIALLAKWPGRVLTHRMILQHVWGPEYGTETQYLRTYATNIRKKFQDTDDVQRLVAKPGVGYCLLDPTQA
jgi:two-component system KDP operon response regulator KdpE